MKQFLIPVDFSKASENAVEAVAKIAEQINAKLLLTHMLNQEEPVFETLDTQSVEKKKSQAIALAQKFKQFCDKSYLKNIIVEPLLQPHFNFKSLSDLAVELNCDLIIMGTAGRDTHNDKASHSNTEMVVRQARIPVLVIKENGPEFSADKILFVNNFELESVAAFHKVEKIARLLHSKLECLYVNLPGAAFKSTREMDALLFEFFKKAGYKDPVMGIKMVHRIADYSIEEGIYSHAQLNAVDIIAIPTHGIQELQRSGASIGEAVANHAIKSVLTVRI